jgi:hypothetical protein
VTAGAGGGLPLRALEGCTSFQTHAVLDMTYYGPLVRRAAEHGVNALAVFVIPDSHYPETCASRKPDSRGITVTY